ncbi:glycosyltransferase [Cytophagaceae bacterium BD1B2-1]|uniref:Glycosyltransferase n=2 Tax=Xanthocytophaga agilis TaxID=3048010 RepID=A0AAE3QYY7_9BACT|nr:glycosyltransferase [Xanthocytophaga agilis]
MQLSSIKEGVITQMNTIAPKRNTWIKRNKYYYKNLVKFLKFNIPENSRILEIGCGTGYLLNELKPSYGVGIDISPEMIHIAKEQFPQYDFQVMDAEQITLKEKFDFIIISDSIGYFEDVQKAFSQLHSVCNKDTRIIITYINFIWLPLLSLAQWLGLKMPQKRSNWLEIEDISNLLKLTDFDIIKHGRRFLLPINIPIISWLCNNYLVHLPFFNLFGLKKFIIARSIAEYNQNPQQKSISVIIPARNEKGNIEAALQRMPQMGSHTEVIFVEGNSTDDTLEEIKRVCAAYSSLLDVKYTTQDGKGKGDAVRKGFAMASGDILVILDADLTVPPEDLPKFYNAIASGKGEYINGSRLVYPMEDEAMRTLNIMGNKFFSIMFSWLLNQRLKDTLCGTKVISQANYQKLIANRSYFGDFDPFGDFDLIFGSSKLNLKIVEIPIRYKARSYGETNISRFKHGWLLLKMVAFAMNKIKFI